MNQDLRRFLIGGAGGLAPVLALLVAVDLEHNLADANLLKVIGYLVRVAALFGIGGLIAWLHQSEADPLKLFEIGAGAPAVLAGLITTHSVAPPVVVGTGWLPLPAAYAQDLRPKPATKEFAPPEREGAGAFLDGLLGTRPDNIYYVIAGSHLSFEDARKQADAINRKQNGFTATVYAPYGGNPYYAVVIGEQVTRERAAQLRRDAAQSGLPRDTYIWSPVAR